MGRAKKPRAVTEVAEAPPANDAPFPEELPEQQPAEIAHALVGPDRVDNYDRLARQREAFGDVAVPQPPAPAPPAQAQPLRRPAPRRVSAEVVKAETALINLERRREDSLAHAETVWAGKRVLLLKSFPADVLAALQAMGVLQGEELEAIGD